MTNRENLVHLLGKKLKFSIKKIDTYMSSSGNGFDLLCVSLNKAGTMLRCDWLVLGNCDWCISNICQQSFRSFFCITWSLASIALENWIPMLLALYQSISEYSHGFLTVERFIPYGDYKSWKTVQNKRICYSLSS